MAFSSRFPADLTSNRLSAAIARARAAGADLIDLTESNPTRAGFHYPADLLEPLADPAALVYRPEPLGLMPAREAVAADFARRGLQVDPARIALTSSTSEAYSLLFKLLCDPGDEVLVPRPSYPLFDHLTRLDAVAPVSYDLEYHGAWSIEPVRAARACSPRTRALLVVNPNNPTGHVAGPRDVELTSSIAATHGAAIISDEVFADYPLSPRADNSSGAFLDRDDVLAFTLGGLSKTIGLPQAKLGWIAVSGPRDAAAAALARLELACDTYLSVSTPVQAAAAALLDRGAPVRRQIQQRIARNDRALRARALLTPSCNVLQNDAGWYAVVQVPSIESEEDLVLALLEREGVVVHPGYFFDFAAESFLVVSLIAEEARFAAGIERIFRHFDCTAVAP